MSIILAIIILGVIIFLHELGHFMTAKYYKMPVMEFAIGMGPKIFTKKIGETDYSIRMLPLGGFVNIAGMQPEENPENEIPGGFYTKPAFSRFVVLIAGVMMNFLTALMAIFILISINIGIMNLLPIPALDGGRLIFIIPEFLGVKINKKIEEQIHLIGMIFLLVLMLIIVFFDVTKYF